MAFSIASEADKDLISKRTKEALQSEETERHEKLGGTKGWEKVNWTFAELRLGRFSRTARLKKLLLKRYHTTEANLHHWRKQRGLAERRGEIIPA